MKAAVCREVGQPLSIEEVAIAVPGLGVTLNEAIARKHPYEGDELHLEMLTEPVR